MGAVTAPPTATDRAWRVVVAGGSAVGRVEGVGDTSTRVWFGLRKSTVPLGKAAAAALMGKGTWRPEMACGVRGVRHKSLDDVLSAPP